MMRAADAGAAAAGGPKDSEACAKQGYQGAAAARGTPGLETAANQRTLSLSCQWKYSATRNSGQVRARATAARVQTCDSKQRAVGPVAAPLNAKQG